MDGSSTVTWPFLRSAVILEELERHGISVVFIDRPSTDDPHEHLVTQIRGAVAEYERTLIADRMRRGRQAKLRAGGCCPGPTHPTAIEYILSGPAIRHWSRSTRRPRPSCANCSTPMLTGGDLARTRGAANRPRIASPTGRRFWSATSVRATSFRRPDLFAQFGLPDHLEP